jgi:hypothetical protein
MVTRNTTATATPPASSKGKETLKLQPSLGPHDLTEEELSPEENESEEDILQR